MLRMAKQKMLPRRITKILTDMGKLGTKAPMCNDCCGAKATRRPWRGKESRHKQTHLRRPTHPGEVVSVDQLESSVPGFIGQMTGDLSFEKRTKKGACCFTVLWQCPHNRPSRHGYLLATDCKNHPIERLWISKQRLKAKCQNLITMDSKRV